jgi:hypothetical protein
MSQRFLAPAVPGIYDDLVNGTCELPQGYGTVISGELDFPEDIKEIEGCDGLISAVLVKDDKIGYTFTALFPSTVTKPEKGANIPFPAVAGSGIQGQVVAAKINWTQGGQRQMTITARHWRNLGSTPTVVAL